ncbi:MULTISPECIES: hypothetical protein [unclassified Roseofilum]|nr:MULTISPECIES: hypothetical protein [unclassified Roseofilum]
MNKGSSKATLTNLTEGNWLVYHLLTELWNCRSIGERDGFS